MVCSTISVRSVPTEAAWQAESEAGMLPDRQMLAGGAYLHYAGQYERRRGARGERQRERTARSGPSGCSQDTNGGGVTSGNAFAEG